MVDRPPTPTFNDLAKALGRVTAERGRTYALDDRVLEATWDPSTTSLFGYVEGRAARPYTTTADWVADGPRGLRFVGGDCSCPMRSGCKHVAALALAGAHADGLEEGEGEPSPTSGWRNAVAAWTSGGSSPEGATAPLGIHLTLRRPAANDPDGPGSVTARLVQHGTRGWVNGNLDWRTISRWSGSGGYGYQHAEFFHDEHVRIAQAIHALSTASSQYGAWASSSRQLELADFAHPQLWPLLDAAVAAGMPLRTGRQGAHPVELVRGDAAEVRVDVTRPDQPSGGRTVTPGVWLAGQRAQPLAFLGDPAHGVAIAADPSAGGHTDAHAEGPFVLAPLARRVPVGLCVAALHRHATVIPAADESAFVTDAQLRLRRVAPVTSTDDSFQPPTISPPRLVARVVPEQADRLQVLWGFRYTVGEQVRDGAVDEPIDDAPWRDATAERQLIADLSPILGPDGFASTAGIDDPIGLRTRTGALRPAALVLDLEAVDLATGLLPALEAHPDADVEVLGGSLPDYRDVTDTVEVSVATRAIPDDRDWFDLDVELSVDGAKVPLGTVFTALAEGRTRLVLADGAHLSLDTPRLHQLRDLIAEATDLQERRSGPPRISRYQADLWEQLAALGVVSQQADAWRQQVEGLLADPSVRDVDVPDGLTATLRPYQQEGFAWLSFLADHGLGGILADDMGLGKTVQALAMILRARQLPGVGDGGPFLVLAPASVVHGWAAEAARFVPDLTVRVVEATFKKVGTTATEVAAEADIVITSYTRFRLDVDAYLGVAWSGLIMDEAQAVKNHRSKLYGCVRRVGAPFTLAITGTPMENDLMELWSLLSITAPGLFPNPSRFKETYLTPIQRNRDAGRLTQLRRRIRPLVLRRTKEAVAADLPPKQEQVLEVELSPAHRKVYDAWLQRERKKVLGLMGDLDEHRFTILRSITLLRMASLHAGLVEDGHARVASAKLDVLVEHLAEVASGGHRALVFSQFTSFLALVRARLQAAGIDHAYLDGSTRRRQQVVQGFKDGGAPVFVISLKAGGVGLNLTEADYVFLLDPWWNPATEAQAIDRTHRIGQTRRVMVYRLIAEDTIEQKVLALSRRKADLIDGVMNEGGAFAGKLSPEDVRALFG